MRTGLVRLGVALLLAMGAWFVGSSMRESMAGRRPDAPEVPVASAKAVAAPADGLVGKAENNASQPLDPVPQAYVALELQGGSRLLWSKGTTRVKCVRTAWDLALPFPAADVRLAPGSNQIEATSVDGLRVAQVDVATGKILSIRDTTKVGLKDEDEDEDEQDREPEALLKRARDLEVEAGELIDALKMEQAAGCLERILACSKALSDLGRQDEAFKVWAVARKLGRRIPSWKPSASIAVPPPPPGGRPGSFNEDEF